MRDDLAPVFKRIEETNAVVLDLPSTWGTATGEVRSFFERWIFQYLTYTDPPQSLFPGKLRTAFIYTMNMTEEGLKKQGMLRDLRKPLCTEPDVHGPDLRAFNVPAVHGHTAVRGLPKRCGRPLGPGGQGEKP